MRVTGSYYSQAMVSQLNTLAARQYKLQNQISTGQKIHAPEDDPAAVQRTMNLRTEQQNIAQYQSNIATLKDRATASYGVISSLKTTSSRAGEIATLADGTRSNKDLTTYGNQVTHLIEDAVQVLNTKYQNQYLFGGTKTDQAPYTLTKDANGAITSVSYNGNAKVSEAEVAAGTAISVDVPGENNSGTGARGLVTDDRTGADFLNHLISLQNHLLAGNSAAVASTDRPALQKDEDNIIYHVANSSTTISRLDASASQASDKALSLQGLVSNETDADLADSIMQLNQTQTAYQAALASGAGLLKMTLMDYLR